MKQSILFMAAIACFAMLGLAAAVILQWREDTWTAVGGFLGFALAKWKVTPYTDVHPNDGDKSSQLPSVAPALELTYLVGAIVAFSTIGWTTGYVHGHGKEAGAISGALAGLILATCVPILLRAPFLARGRSIQLLASGVAFLGILVVVWVMYRHLLE